jgi:hypothetical protein
MAARWNSSRAPVRPRKRMRSKRWWVFRCANRISTLFLSSRDFSNSGVAMSARAWSRASSFTSRGTLRQETFGQHFDFKGQGSQSNLLARYRIVRPSCTLPVVRSTLSFGHLYSFFSLSNIKSLRENVPSSRLPFSHTGICGVMPAPTSQPSNLPVPYAVSAASRSGRQIEPLFGTLDHSLGSRHLIVCTCRGRLDVDDHCVLDVDQIVQPVAELHALVRFRCPSRAGIGWRNHLWRFAIRVEILIVET